MKREKEVYLYEVTIYDENDDIKDIMNVKGKDCRDAFRNYEIIKGRTGIEDSYSAVQI